MAVAATSARAQSLQSSYVTMDDGVRLAADVHLPPNLTPDSRIPAVMELTRYWRGIVDPATGKSRPGRDGLSQFDRGFLENGYAVVKVDVRGSGASFGHRLEEYGPREVRDGYAIVDWVCKQPWCDGNVGAYGISYSGTTAEFLASSKHPALKAVIPGWSDFDLYVSPGRPYGLSPHGFVDQWGQMVGWMDENNTEKMGGSVRPVDPNELAAAVKEHEANPDVAALEKQTDFRDVSYQGSRPMSECASVFWKADIEASNVPMLVMASWLDAGTADGALLRFQHYRNRQYLLILASSHGGISHASPFVVGEKPIAPVPSRAEQFAIWLAFMDHFLKSEQNEVAQWPPIRYFNMGEENFHDTDVWPPSGSQTRDLYLAADAALVTQPPNQLEGADRYRVDFEVTTGEHNRWMTQMGQPIYNIHRREAMDAKMQCYTSEPLATELQITGTPEVHLWLSASQADGAVLAYLEDVAPDGQSRYLTEGGLRFMHRKVTVDPNLPHEILPHSFSQKDRMDLVPGEVSEIKFRMWPTSVKLPAGHRVRVAIAGADQLTFGRLPPQGDLELTLFRNQRNASRVILPILVEAKKSP
jgi:putative CocE/NonD family hydrolase